MTTLIDAPKTCCGSSVADEISHCGRRKVCLVCGKSWYPFEIRPPTPLEIAETNIGFIDMEQYHEPDSKEMMQYRKRNFIGIEKKGKGALHALGRY